MKSSTEPVAATAALHPAGSKRKPLLIGITIFFFFLALTWGLYYALVLIKREKTDDAYVGGNQVMLTSQVSGTVVAIRADNTQLVRAGQEIIHLDSTDADLTLMQAKTQLAETVRQVKQQFLQADQFAATVALREIELAKTRDDYNRRQPLLAERSVAAEDVEHARKTLQIAAAALDVARKQAAAARAYTADVSLARHPAVLKARINFKLAFINARRHAIVAPVTGYVAGRTVQVGQRVASGAVLLTIVPLDQLWVDANFKEVELRHIRIGQPATVETDLYGGSVVYHGQVVGLAAGTGSSFSLLPPQNATGNWIKIVQRVPIRIVLDPKELAVHPLRIGLSTVVQVRTENRGGPVLALVPHNEPLYTTKVYDHLAEGADRIAEAVIRENADGDSGLAAKLSAADGQN